ncbi:MAG: glutamate formimidoyltransferase [Elusimicrobia bacterium]|nr:glutamate formimidoyltransferase [Elusimicrobiota bacterium]
MKLVQCVPNFSEGRDPAKVQAIVAAIREAGVVLMDIEMDKDHHRSVVTFVGAPDAVAEGAFRGAKKAVELIDMRRHKGEHPRMGATDVIPFTPLFGVDLKECVALSQKLGERLAKELDIPVFLYGFSATRPERENLANVRKGEFEGLSEALGKDSSRNPDFGQPKIHPTAGATAVGAREQIINFNVNLATGDMNLAKEITKKIRTSSGGLPYLRAKEIELSDPGKVQVSTVLTNYPVTGLSAVYRQVDSLARAAGAAIAETELIGLVPAAALEHFAIEELRVKGFDPAKQVLESKLLELLAGETNSSSASGSSWESGLGAICDALAAPLPVPGGGSASAAASAMGASLAMKVFQIRLKKSLKTGENGRGEAKIKELITRVSHWAQQLRRLAVDDAVSYQAVADAYRLPKTDPKRGEAIQEALKKAAETPLTTLRTTVECAMILAGEKELVPGSMASDYQVGLGLLAAGGRGAKENVLINLPLIEDEAYKNRLSAQAEALEASLKERLG